MIRAVIFDMDGVIIDSEPLHFKSDQLTMKYFGKDISCGELNHYVGVSNSVMWTDLQKKYNIDASVQTLMEKQSYYKKSLVGNKKLEPIVGITSLLDEIKESGLKIGLASSSNRDFIVLILKNLGIIDYFSVIVSGEDVDKSKPEPDIFLKAAEKLDVHPKDCLVIEDAQHGVKAAKLAGMTCIGFSNPNSGTHDLSLADTVVSSITEINLKNYRCR